jgi:hypothetical protein
LTTATELSQNSIERFKTLDDTDRKQGNVREKHSKLKSVYKDMKNSYSNLERLTEVVGETQRPKDFIDPRVRELWAMAVKANLSQEELSSFRVGYFRLVVVIGV